ncbi:MAG TPA: FKBP-type peptidyl-prolyl cis-trans isomerase [Chitinophagaceae bacterium]|nr:FKBP-type peptidyl-prolyl cis-trans isomerase [Chitinophagaceae bacterium]
MNLVKKLLLFVSLIAIVVSCNKITYRKTPGGMPYKLFSSGDTQKVENGNIIKISFIQKINDSVYFSNIGKPPFYVPVNQFSASPYDVSEIWTSLKVGDSIVATQMMDTFIKRNPQGVMPQFKKGDRIISFIKIIDRFTNNDSATADEKKEKQKWQDEEVAFLKKYLDDKKIQYQKTPSGAFVEFINPGTGNTIDSGKYVSVNYTGTSFSGVKFDSNTDTSFHHVEPYSFTVGAGQMITGFDEAVEFMKNGGTARVYVPSSLAYGPRPGTDKIKPYEHLIFDVTIVDVKDRMPTRAELEKLKTDSTQPKK